MTGPLFTMPIASSFGYPNMYDSYSNQVFLNDLTGMNWYTPSFNYNMFNPMDMQSSIFNCMPYCMPNMNYNSDTYYQNMDKYYENMMNNQVRYQQRTREADITLNAAYKNMRQKGLVLNEKIQLNEQEQIMPAFKDYVESVRSYYGKDADDEDLKNTALELYQQQFGNTIQKDIRTNGSDSFLHGLKQVGLLGFGDKTSAEDNIAKITGQPKGKTEKYKEWGGNALAGVGLTGGALALSGKLREFCEILGKRKYGKAALIGAGIGWLGGRIIDLFS